MKKRYSIIILISLGLLFQTSCLKEYLDKAPEAGLSEQAVFSKYENFKLFFNQIYNASSSRDIRTAYSLYFNFWNQKVATESFTDMSDQGRSMFGQVFKGGTCGPNVWMMTYDDGRRSVFASMWRCIRISNITLDKIKLLQDATEAEKADFIAQAYFIRGFAHFTLVKWWGGMPYLTKVLGSDDAWDMPRLTSYETLSKAAADMDTALIYFQKAGTMRRDNPISGAAGHLNNDNLYRPNGCAALGIKARILLYAASPLNNAKGKTDWENAAKANAAALDTALNYGYFMHSQADYTLNWYGTRYTDEELWGWSFGNFSFDSWDGGGGPTYLGGVFANRTGTNSGVNPSQNFVDKYETRWGEPLNTQADRDAATAAGHYKEQDPYTNRDPRFYTTVIYNNGPLAGFGTAKIYYTRNANGSISYSELLNQSYQGISRTGYYLRKLTGDVSYLNKVTPLLTDPIIRITELYLNYAEAANEAYGPKGKVPNFWMTSEEALNKVRTRMSMPNVLSQYTLDADAFRPRIKNERNIELSFEGHYYFDIRRWKDAPEVMSTPMIGMDIEKVPISATYPTGYKYTRLPLPADRQVRWKDAMYYLPFDQGDKKKMTLFTPNEEW